MGKIKIEKEVHPVSIINDVDENFNLENILNEISKDEYIGTGIFYTGMAGSWKNTSCNTRIFEI